MTATRRGARLALTLLLALAGAVALVPVAPALAAEEEPYVLEIYTGAGSGYGEVTCEYKEGGVKQNIFKDTHTKYTFHLDSESCWGFH